MTSDNRLVARWESKGGAHVVELWKQGSSGWCYRSEGASGYLGNQFASDVEALAAFEPRVDNFQPDRNKTPMRMVQGPKPDTSTTSKKDRSAHTPGPWKIRDFGPEAPGLDVVALDGEYLAAIKHDSRGGWRPNSDTALANAQLMAAAPDLLAELQSCEQLLGLLLAGNMPPDRNDSRWAEVGECKIRAAALIRKARGE